METNIIVFTDGSSLNNAGAISFGGIGIHFPNGELDDISEPFLLKPITNQRTELYAIYIAIKEITNNLNFDTITIYSDSEYSIKSLTTWINTWKNNNWKSSTGKPVKNKDIIEPINELMEKYPKKIKFKHVRSHTGKQDFESISNDKADKLAVNGSNRGKQIITALINKNKKASSKKAISKAETKKNDTPKKKKVLRVKTD